MIYKVKKSRPQDFQSFLQDCGRKPRFSGRRLDRWNFCELTRKNALELAASLTKEQNYEVAYDFAEKTGNLTTEYKKQDPFLQPDTTPKIVSPPPTKAAKQDFQKLLMFAALGIGGFLAYKYLIMKKAKK